MLKKERFFSWFRIGLLFYLIPLVLSAQESDLFNRLLKETLRPNFPLSLDFSDTVFQKKLIRLDVTKEPLPTLGFNYKQNLLFFYSGEDFTFPKPHKISPCLTMFYSNHNKFDPNSTETTGDVIANVALCPLANIIMINPMGLLDFMKRTGLLSDKPFVLKKNKRERMLKIITQDVYHINDDY